MYGCVYDVRTVIPLTTNILYVQMHSTDSDDLQLSSRRVEGGLSHLSSLFSHTI
jgi:hypothetical protein